MGGDSVERARASDMPRNDLTLVAYLFFDVVMLLLVLLASGTSSAVTGSAVASYCSEDWDCGAWDCVNLTHEGRICVDLNSCGTAQWRPFENRHEESCTQSDSEASADEDIPSSEEDVKSDVEGEAKLAVSETTLSDGSAYEPEAGRGAPAHEIRFDSGQDDNALSEPSSLSFEPSLDLLPSDSPCTRGWPAHQGGPVSFNELAYACDLFEVADSRLYPMVEEAAECCASSCSESLCHDFCGPAYREGLLSADSRKTCEGLYIIYALGPARQWMQDYYAAEFACAGDLSFGCSPEDVGTCGCSDQSPKDGAQLLQCESPYEGISPRSWVSDIDLSKNTCFASDMPAHVSLTLLSTGTCVDYSVSLTTLLRLAGFAQDEVYSLEGKGHAYNLVRFPGERRWNVVDVNDNTPIPYRQSGLPHADYDYCSYESGSCANDAYQGACPADKDVKGCAS